MKNNVGFLTLFAHLLYALQWIDSQLLPTDEKYFSKATFLQSDN